MLCGASLQVQTRIERLGGLDTAQQGALDSAVREAFRGLEMQARCAAAQGEPHSGSTHLNAISSLLEAPK